MQVTQRLGYWHVWSTLGDAHGLHFSLDLSDPEQKEVARDIVKTAAKESARARAEARAKGVSAQVGG